MYGSSKAQVNPGILVKSGMVERDVVVEEQISDRVMGLDLDELYQANRLLNQSEALHTLMRMQELLRHGYKFNPLEQRLFDKFFDHYNANYRSPLASALKEDEEV